MLPGRGWNYSCGTSPAAGAVSPVVAGKARGPTQPPGCPARTTLLQHGLATGTRSILCLFPIGEHHWISNCFKGLASLQVCFLVSPLLCIYKRSVVQTLLKALGQTRPELDSLCGCKSTEGGSWQNQPNYALSSCDWIHQSQSCSVPEMSSSFFPALLSSRESPLFRFI